MQPAAALLNWLVDWYLVLIQMDPKLEFPGFEKQELLSDLQFAPALMQLQTQ